MKREPPPDFTWPRKQCPCGTKQRGVCQQHGCWWEREPSRVPMHLRQPLPPTHRERFIGALRHVAALQPDPRLSIDAVMSVYDYVYAFHAKPEAQPVPDGAEAGISDEPKTKG